MAIHSHRSNPGRALLRTAMAATGLILASVPAASPAAAADDIYVRDHRAAKVYVAPLARFRDAVVVRETYRGEGGDAFTNALYELDCATRTIRYIGGPAPGQAASVKDSEFYAGAYTKAHDALCNKYKDSAEWGG